MSSISLVLLDFSIDNIFVNVQSAAYDFGFNDDLHHGANIASFLNIANAMGRQGDLKVL